MKRTRTRQMSLLALLLTTLVAAAACESEPRADQSAATTGTKVDSALPIPILLERFRATVADTPTVVAGGAATPDALTQALFRAIAANDTAAVRNLALSRGEFAWLYYPHTRNVAPPYELGPELVWLTLVASSDKGASRFLARYGGRALRFESLTCPESASVEGPLTILRGCHVRFAAADSAPREMRLFGALLGRDGRYKFLSYANDL